MHRIPWPPYQACASVVSVRHNSRDHTQSLGSSETVTDVIIEDLEEGGSGGILKLMIALANDDHENCQCGG